MLKVDVSSKVTQKMKDFEAQAPGKVAVKLNGAAFAARKALQEKMEQTFQGGVSPYLKRSVWVEQATPQKVVATVGARDTGGKSDGPEQILRTQIRGGDRVLKASERRLRAAGILPNGYFLVPGQGAVLNRLGNIEGRFMSGLLSYLQAYNQAGSELNMSAKKRAKYADKKGGKIQGFEYFVAYGKLRDNRGLQLAPGIYHRTGTHGVNVTPILMFVKKPHYTARLPWHATAHQAVHAYLSRRVLPA